MGKHILVVSQYYFPENFRINDITKEWIKRGYQVTVVTGIPNYPKGHFFKGYGYLKKRKENIEGVEIIRLAITPRFNRPLFLALNYFSFVISGWFWAKFTKLKADLVFNFEVSPMTQALPAIWFAKRRAIPSYIYVQDLWPENLKIVGGINNSFTIKIVNKMVDFIYKNSTKILVTSESFKQSIVNRGFDEKKIIVWPQYAEDFYKPLKKELKNSEGNLTIIFTGNIGEAQGLEILPLVAKDLKSRGLGGKVKFMIVGNGRNKENLVQTVNSSSTSELFLFLEAVPAIDIPLLLSKADVAFISFSDNELFQKTIPAKLQSYLACGMPILAIASGETKRIVEEANCGLVSDPGNVAKAVDNIIKFMKLNREKLIEMSQQSILYSKNHYDKNELINRVDALFMGE